ncbi:hypothetical protein EQ500_10185 [Lactobacillus sp. XV13L]|nr:hypothetical protein [Lactobacillus sp. XV13L]
MKKKSYWALATLGALILMLSAPTAALASRQSLPVKAQRVRLMRPLKVRRSDQITFMIFLKPRKQEDYFKEARAVNEPGNTDFKHFMTPDQIRQEYGQPQSLTARWQNCCRTTT